MGKKIIITGGLGYIGTELCKIYSGYSWNDQITVIDNRFISERVNQLRNWNINFVQGDILDKDLINFHCRDADVIHHLAGITKVARVKDSDYLNPKYYNRLFAKEKIDVDAIISPELEIAKAIIRKLNTPGSFDSFYLGDKVARIIGLSINES